MTVIVINWLLLLVIAVELGLIFNRLPSKK
jgi:hypothetical protein